MSDNDRNRCELQKKIEQALKRVGEDSNLRHALVFHLGVLRDSNPEEKIETRMEQCRYLLSKMCLDKMDLYPTQPFECKLDENSDWPLAPLPSELFGVSQKQEDSDKEIWFYANLKIGDVLDCRVSAVSETSCQLRVIHKYGVTRLLDDLQLIATMIYTKHEIDLLEQKQLLVTEYVRVAVSKIDRNDTSKRIEIYVTIDKDLIQTFKSLPKLGRISENEVPSYVFESPDTEKFSSYSEYLNSKPQFQNPHFYNGLIEKCGIDPKIVYSYFPEYNRKECVEGQTGQALLKESKLDDAKRLANSALKYLEKDLYEESLKSVEEALKICPTDDSLMSKLYDIRADICYKQTKPALPMKYYCDLERAYRMSPEDKSIKKKFLKLVYKVMHAHYISKNYKSAMKFANLILEHDKNHRPAKELLNHLQLKYADKLLDLEGKDLLDLQEKKKELLSELKRCQES